MAMLNNQRVPKNGTRNCRSKNGAIKRRWLEWHQFHQFDSPAPSDLGCQVNDVAWDKLIVEKG